jgi:hypothetical protein
MKSRLLITLAAVVIFVLVPLMNLWIPADSPFHLSAFGVTLGGKIMCYMIVAIAMDLVWGYAGILSLGHGLFFALGGYAMGMYLMRQIRDEGQYRVNMPDFMVFLDWKEFPLAWWNSESFLWCMFLVVAVPGPPRVRLRLLRFPLAREGRVLLDHHAGAHVRRDAALLPQQHRLRRQQRASPTSSASSTFPSRRPKRGWRCSRSPGATLIARCCSRASS